MKKKTFKSKSSRKQQREKLFLGVIIALVVLAVVFGVIELITGGNKQTYTVTEDGHIHAADGTHIGTLEELLGESGYTISEDGHIHAEDGTHVGDLSDLVAGEDSHDHSEDEAAE